MYPLLFNTYSSPLFSPLCWVVFVLVAEEYSFPCQLCWLFQVLRASWWAAAQPLFIPMVRVLLLTFVCRGSPSSLRTNGDGADANDISTSNNSNGSFGGSGSSNDVNSSDGRVMECWVVPHAVAAGVCVSISHLCTVSLVCTLLSEC